MGCSESLTKCNFSFSRFSPLIKLLQEEATLLQSNDVCSQTLRVFACSYLVLSMSNIEEAFGNIFSVVDGELINNIVSVEAQLSAKESNVH